VTKEIALRCLITRPFWTGLVIFQLFHAASAQDFSSHPAVAPGLYGRLPNTLSSYTVVLRPDTIQAEYWAGAPSVIVDKDGVFWMACRMRTAKAPRGWRGYEIRILSSKDGVHFHKENSIRSDQVPIPGFERPALVYDADRKLYKLYGCGPWQKGPWSIIKWPDVKNPRQWQANTAYPVITPTKPRFERDIRVSEYKDPVLFHSDSLFHCYVIGYLRNLERIFHFSSADGEQWQAVGEPNQSLLPLAGWHDFFVRPAAVLPVGVGYLFFYEGSCSSWYDPVYNVVTGLAFTYDLHTLIDLTPSSPLFVSSTPSKFYTWRYCHWVQVKNELWAYAEVADRNETSEIRLFKIKITERVPYDTER
jgi:hypothetical protein